MEETTLEKVPASISRSSHLRHVDCYDLDSAKGNRRRKYIFTDQIDQLIREIYLNRRESKNHACIPLLSKKVGMPHWALKKRARELGLARTKELTWSERELEILARYAWMSDERIRLKLKAAGYVRTVTGIHLKLRRMGFKHDGASIRLRPVKGLYRRTRLAGIGSVGAFIFRNWTIGFALS